MPGAAARLLVGAMVSALIAAPAAVASPAHLTPSHEAEHARQAAAVEAERARLAAMSPAERSRLEARQAAVRRAALAVPPEQGGAWSPPFAHRSYGMHAALLPTGKVLFWSLPLNGYDPRRDNEALAWLWDPRRGTGPGAFENIDPPRVDSDGDGNLERAPIWCSGQSFLPDGRLLVAGGTREWGTDGDVGWEAVFTFNPWNETWARQPDMAHGRWYPSQVLTGDGTTYIASGYTEDLDGDVVNKRLERFAPSPDADGTDGIVETLGDPDGTSFALYPHLFALPDGRVAAAGPVNSDVALLDTATGDWDRLFDDQRRRPLMSQNRIGGTAVLEPSGPRGSAVVTNIGGWAGGGASSTHDPSVATTETIDFLPAQGWPRWRLGEPLNVARANHNTVLLPDGGMVTVGGGSGRSDSAGVRAMYADGRSSAVELRAPGGGPWRLGAAQAEDRGYHSTALLLPDGRVMSAGDDVHPDSDGDTIEIYSPPYLFRGDRPVIERAPGAIGYGDRFAIGSPDADLQRAVLMAPSATTHAVDMTQRHVELEVGQRLDGGLALRSPAHADLAPPGWYMLFVLDADGVPSLSRWVRVAPGVDAPDPPGAEPEPEPEQPVPPGPAGDVAPPAPPVGPSPPRRGREDSRSAVPDGLAPALRVEAMRRRRRVRFALSVDERALVEARLARIGTRTAFATLRQVVAPGTTRLALRIPRRARRRTVRLAVVATDAAGNVRRVGRNLVRR